MSRASSSTSTLVSDLAPEEDLAGECTPLLGQRHSSPPPRKHPTLPPTNGPGERAALGIGESQHHHHRHHHHLPPPQSHAGAQPRPRAAWAASPPRPLVAWWTGSASDSSPARSPTRQHLLGLLSSLPAVLLGLVLNGLDAMSYGIILFPHGDPLFAASGKQAGISMFLFSSFLSQLVYSLGGSAFRGAVGSMMIEIVPFLHLMCRVVEGAMPPDARPATVIATILAAYASSTLLTGLVFLLLGLCRAGSLIKFFPRHILVGCIGGIGLFLLRTGVEVTTGLEVQGTWASLLAFWSPGPLQVWGTSLALAVVLKVLRTRCTHALLVPAFYVALPLVFYTVLYASGSGVERARIQGWVFPQPTSSQDSAFWLWWTWFDVRHIHWRAFLATGPTQLAAAFFALLHVPINIPALALSTGEEVDMDREMVGHGVSNLLSGALGSLQNYVVYSNSLLYMRSGAGKYRASGVLLAALTAYLFTSGAGVIGWIPTPVVGSLIFLLGLDLLQESLVDTLRAGIHPLEYATLLLLMGTMAVVGFVEGIGVGLLLACLAFVLLYARRPVVGAYLDAGHARSTVHRPAAHHAHLDRAGGAVRVVRLQGYLFFGSVHQLEPLLAWLLPPDARGENAGMPAAPTQHVLVLDFARTTGIDYSAYEYLAKLKRRVAERGARAEDGGTRGPPVLLFAGLRTSTIAHLGPFGPRLREGVPCHPSVEEALSWCEDLLLAQAFEPAHLAECWAEEEVGEPSHHLLLTPRPLLPGHRLEEDQQLMPLEVQPQHPFLRLLREFAPGDASLHVDAERMLPHLCGRMELVHLPPRTLVWREGEAATCAYLVQAGCLLAGRVHVAPIDGIEGGVHDDDEADEAIDDNDPDLAPCMVHETHLPGSWVGILECLAHRPRLTTCWTREPVQAWRLGLERDPSELEHNTQQQGDAELMRWLMRLALTSEHERRLGALRHWRLLGGGGS